MPNDISLLHASKANSAYKADNVYPPISNFWAFMTGRSYAYAYDLPLLT